MTQEKFLYAFDLDDTLLRFNCSCGFYRFQLFRGRVSPRSLINCLGSYLFHRFFQGHINLIYKSFFDTFLEGKHLELLETWIAQYFASLSVKDIFYQPCLNYLLEALSLDYPVVIISSSPEFLVKQFARILNVKHFIGSVYTCNEKGFYAKSGSLLDGNEKAVKLAQYIESFQVDRVYCFANSIHDLPFLLAGTQAIAVNPDRRLKKLSMHKSWPII